MATSISLMSLQSKRKLQQDIKELPKEILLEEDATRNAEKKAGRAQQKQAEALAKYRMQPNHFNMNEWLKARNRTSNTLAGFEGMKERVATRKTTLKYKQDRLAREEAAEAKLQTLYANNDHSSPSATRSGAARPSTRFPGVFSRYLAATKNKITKRIVKVKTGLHIHATNLKRLPETLPEVLPQKQSAASQRGSKIPCDSEYGRERKVEPKKVKHQLPNEIDQQQRVDSAAKRGAKRSRDSDDQDDQEIESKKAKLQDSKKIDQRQRRENAIKYLQEKKAKEARQKLSRSKSQSEPAVDPAVPVAHKLANEQQIRGSGEVIESNSTTTGSPIVEASALDSWSSSEKGDSADLSHTADTTPASWMSRDDETAAADITENPTNKSGPVGDGMTEKQESGPPPSTRMFGKGETSEIPSSMSKKRTSIRRRSETPVTPQQRGLAQPIEKKRKRGEESAEQEKSRKLLKQQVGTSFVGVSNHKNACFANSSLHIIDAALFPDDIVELANGEASADMFGFPDPGRRYSRQHSGRMTTQDLKVLEKLRAQVKESTRTGSLQLSPYLVDFLMELRRKTGSKDSASALVLQQALAYSEDRLNILNGDSQEDAGEFLLELLDKVTGEKPAFGDFFRLEQAEAVKCADCGYHNSQKTSNVMLHVNTASAETTMTGMPGAARANKVLLSELLQFGKTEELEDHQCERCLKIGSSQKTSEVTQAPKNLIVQIDRATAHGKNKTAVEVVNDKPISVGGKQYLPVAMVKHQGSSAKAGHYTANRKLGNEWVLVDDAVISTKNALRDDGVRGQHYYLVLLQHLW